MGIKKLSTFLEKKFSDCVIVRDLSYYKGKTVGVDVSLYLYKYSYYNGNYYLSFLNMLNRFMMNGIKVVFFFDGKPSSQKDFVLEKRKEKKIKASNQLDILIKINKLDKNEDKISLYKTILEEKINKLKLNTDIKYTKQIKVLSSIIDDNDKILKEIKTQINKHKNNSFKITPQIIKNLIKLFDMIGVSYIICNDEAEVICAKMIEAGYLDCCITEDVDVLPNGGELLLKGFKHSSNNVKEFSLSRALEKTKLTREQFIDYCILSGCDYCSTIYRVGHKSIYKYIQKYGSIEKIIDFLSTKPMYKDGFDYFEYKKARNIFMKKFNKETDIINKINFKLTNTCSFEDLFEFMKSEFNKTIKFKLYNIYEKFVSNKSKIVLKDLC